MVALFFFFPPFILLSYFPPFSPPFSSHKFLAFSMMVLPGQEPKNGSSPKEKQSLTSDNIQRSVNFVNQWETGRVLFFIYFIIIFVFLFLVFFFISFFFHLCSIPLNFIFLLFLPLTLPR